MAKDYNQVLLDKGYTQDQINQMKSQVASGQKASDVINNMNSQIANSKTTTTNTTPTSNTASTATSKSSSTGTFGYPTEYQGTGTNKANSYQNQGAGKYSYDTGTQYYEKQGTTQNDNYSKIRDEWNNLTYAQQQEKLKQNPNLKAGVEKVGGTFKTKETTPTAGTTGTKTETTPKQGEWDYQSDSPERMAEIAANLEGYKQTMPYLFNDKRAFDDFFINGKGRSQAQIDFLNQWFENNKKYGKYDALTPDSIGYGIAYGDIPEDYLTMLKTTDPAKYQAALQAKQDAEDKIKDKTSLDTTSALSGESEATITSNVIEWLKSQGLFLDKDGNLIDDRTENYATDEEKDYAKNAADIIARNLDIDNTVKHTYDDLVKAYPGATKATLMAMAQDKNSDLLREKENNNVELTRLQGYMNYMQSERQERNKIGENAIKQLQDQYGMYYDYTPEGMSELAQAKYAATNVTLDQADRGTDTQKQMALQSVLDDYYDKYGSIIQRGEQQVINDVMAYAKKNGVSLSQALEENFLKPLRSKPEFSQLNTLQSDPYTVKSGDITYVYDPVTKTFSPIGGGAAGNSLGGGTSSGQLYGFTNYTPIATEKKEATLENFMNTRTEGSYGGQCGEFVNDYLQALGYDRLYDDPIDKKKAVTNSDTATVGSIAVMDSQKYPGNGHVAIVTDVQGDKVKLLESNWNNDKKVHTTRWVNKSDILGYFDPSKEPKQTTTTDLLNAKFGGTGPDWNKNGYFDSMKPLLEKFLEEGKIDSTDTKYSDLKNSYHITDQEFNQMAQNYARTEGKANELESVSSALEAAINLYEYINGDKSTLLGVNDSKQGGLFDWLGGYVPKLGGDAYDAKGYYDTLGDRLTLDKLIETKKQGATYGAMSEGEWELLKNAATSLDWGSSSDKFQKNLEDMIYTMVRTIEEGGGKLPSNYAGSTASKEYLQWQKNGRYDKYKSEGGNKGGGNSGEPEML